MPKQRINLTIDETINKEWKRIAKKYGWSKSHMLEDWLRTVLPILDKSDPRDLLMEYDKFKEETEKQLEQFKEGK